jgi:hypothetical protein
VSCEESRLAILRRQGFLSFVKASLEETEAFNGVFSRNGFGTVIIFGGSGGCPVQSGHPKA